MQDLVFLLFWTPHGHHMEFTPTYGTHSHKWNSLPCLPTCGIRCPVYLHMEFTALSTYIWNSLPQMEFTPLSTDIWNSLPCLPTYGIHSHILNSLVYLHMEFTHLPYIWNSLPHMEFTPTYRIHSPVYLCCSLQLAWC